MDQKRVWIIYNGQPTPGELVNETACGHFWVKLPHAQIRVNRVFDTEWDADWDIQVGHHDVTTKIKGQGGYKNEHLRLNK